jgi:hypothetical protein
VLKFWKPTHFKPQEFLPPGVYNDYGERALYILMDPRILWTMDALRERLNLPIIVNTYHNGGSFTQRGFRTDQTIGAELSQHRYGRACDFTITGWTSEMFRQTVRTNAKILGDSLQYITRIEDDVSWCHIDVAGILSDQITFFHK